MVYLIIMWCCVSLIELGLMYWINRREPELTLPIKKYSMILFIGNLALCFLSWYKQSIGGSFSYWYFGIFTYLFCLTIYDLKFKELPDWWHIALLVFYIGLWIAGKQRVSLWESGIITVVLTLIFGLIFLLKKEALGVGDMKLLLVCSIYAGSLCIGMMIRGMIVAFFVSIVMLLCKKATAKTELPFVPFLFLAALVM